MNVRFKIKIDIEHDYDIDFSNEKPIISNNCVKRENEYAPFFKFSFKYPNELAPSLKYGGRFVIVSEFIPPFVEYSEDVENASLDDPIELHSSKITVHARPMRAMVVDALGKEVWSCLLSSDSMKEGI